MITRVSTSITPKILDMLRDGEWETQSEAVKLLRSKGETHAANEILFMKEDEFGDFVCNAVDDD